MPRITNLSLTFDPSVGSGGITFIINWAAEDGPVGTPGT